MIIPLCCYIYPGVFTSCTLLFRSRIQNTQKCLLSSRRRIVFSHLSLIGYHRWYIHNVCIVNSCRKSPLSPSSATRVHRETRGPERIGTDLVDAGRPTPCNHCIPPFVTMLLARKTLRAFSTASLSSRRRRCLSTRASTILSALDIPTTPTELPGVYDGQWKGSGDLFQSVCPTTGEILAHINSVKTFLLFLLALSP
jgi:hypothetical protein